MAHIGAPGWRDTQADGCPSDKRRNARRARRGGPPKAGCFLPPAASWGAQTLGSHDGAPRS